MASSGKPKPSVSSIATRSKRHLDSRVADNLKHLVLPGQRLTLALSGGVDSMVLLDVLTRLARRMEFRFEALHVDHQISSRAGEWARFCRTQCRARGVTCRVITVDVPRRNSVERSAREARYTVFAHTRADHIVLAHNQDDQAETVLLQLLRGAGVRGLSAMPPARALRSPSVHPGPAIIRPLLDTPRREIEAYAKRHKVQWVEDESNAETRYTRNWLRREVLPRIAERVPAYRETLARAARNMAEAALLLDELARMDAATVMVGNEPHVERLRALSMERAKNLLRFLMDAQGWHMPDSARLTEGLRQALHARRDAKVMVSLGSCELHRHAGLIHLVPSQPAPADDVVLTWRGEREIALPNGVLTLMRCRGTGMSTRRLGSGPVTIRHRRGGERLQPDPRRPRRTVKNLLQEAGVPPWQRERLPFIYCGAALACVPGIGVDCRFQAAPGEASIVASWRDLQPTRNGTSSKGAVRR